MHIHQVAAFIKERFPELSITRTHDVGQLGILERENAAVLNESLKPMCRKTIKSFREALDKLGLTCPFYLTQNDGTLIRYYPLNRGRPISISAPANEYGSHRGSLFNTEIKFAKQISSLWPYRVSVPFKKNPCSVRFEICSINLIPVLKVSLCGFRNPPPIAPVLWF